MKQAEIYWISQPSSIVRDSTEPTVSVTTQSDSASSTETLSEDIKTSLPTHSFTKFNTLPSSTFLPVINETESRTSVVAYQSTTSLAVSNEAQYFQLFLYAAIVTIQITCILL